MVTVTIQGCENSETINRMNLYEFKSFIFDNILNTLADPNYCKLP